MNCWKCLKSISEEPLKIGFRASCMHCSSDLHVCVNCRYYAIGKPNDCLIPGTEPIRDREKANLCEDFKPKTLQTSSPSSERAKRLFGEDELPKKKTFDSLFKEET